MTTSIETDNSSSEMFYRDENGKKCDAALHGSDNPGKAYCDRGVRDAIARGVSPEDAERRYGYRPAPQKSLDEIMKR